MYLHHVRVAGTATFMESRLTHASSCFCSERCLMPEQKETDTVTELGNAHKQALLTGARCCS